MCILHVELSDGNYTLVSKVQEEGADGDVHHVEVNQDLDQSSEESNASFVYEGKHRNIT